MIGIETRWECPSCGNVLRQNQPFWSDTLRKKVDQPKRCSCGRKAKFNLLSIGQCEYELVGTDKTPTVVKEHDKNDDKEE